MPDNRPFSRRYLLNYNSFAYSVSPALSLSFTSFFAIDHLVNKKAVLRKNPSPNIPLKISSIPFKCSSNRGYYPLKTIRNALTKRYCFSRSTIPAICWESLPSESPSPGVSMSINLGWSVLPYHQTSCTVVSNVTEVALAELLKRSGLPHSDVQVALFPVPVDPITQSLERSIFEAPLFIFLCKSY